MDSLTILCSVLRCLYLFLGAAGITLTSQSFRAFQVSYTVRRADKIFRPFAHYDYEFSRPHFDLLRSEAFERASISQGSLFLLISVALGGALQVGCIHINPPPTLSIASLTLAFITGLIFGIVVCLKLQDASDSEACKHLEQQAREDVKKNPHRLDYVKTSMSWFKECCNHEPDLPNSEPP